MTSMIRPTLNFAACAAVIALDAAATVKGFQTIHSFGSSLIDRACKIYSGKNKEKTEDKPKQEPKKQDGDTSGIDIKALLSAFTSLTILKSTKGQNGLVLDTLRYCAFAGIAHGVAYYLGANANLSLAQRIVSWIPSSK